MTNKKVVIPLLLVLSVAIWSHNIYRVIKSVFNADDETMVEDAFEKASEVEYTLKLNDKPREKFVYQAEFRDPFQDWLHLKKQKKSQPEALKVEVPVPPVRLPPLRFTGLLQDSSGNLAVIEDPQGQIHFVDVNDSASGVIITSITEQIIKCTYKEKEFTLKLRR
ncbi:MAG: hypothetical protein R6V04_03335 [bacterium]